MAKLRIARQAWADIQDVKRHTEQRFGALKRAEYEELIHEGLRAIATDPASGKPRSAARPDVLAYHIAKQGRRARHLIFYRLRSDGIVEVMRVLHDSMDFDRHLPK